MADPVMGAIEMLGVYAVDVPHAGGEIAVDGFQEQVVVIAHKAESITEPVEALDSLFGNVEESRPVPVAFEDRHPGVSSRRIMIECPWIFNAQRSGHGFTMHDKI